MNTIITWPADLTRIDINNASELEYWEARFNTSSDKIREAIGEVGPLTIAVDRFLNSETLNYSIAS